MIISLKLDQDICLLFDYIGNDLSWVIYSFSVLKVILCVVNISRGGKSSLRDVDECALFLQLATPDEVSSNVCNQS